MVCGLPLGSSLTLTTVTAFANMKQKVRRCEGQPGSSTSSSPSPCKWSHNLCVPATVLARSLPAETLRAGWMWGPSTEKRNVFGRWPVWRLSLNGSTPWLRELRLHGPLRAARVLWLVVPTRCEPSFDCVRSPVAHGCASWCSRSLGAMRLLEDAMAKTCQQPSSCMQRHGLFRANCGFLGL